VNPEDVEFLTVNEVLELHALQLVAVDLDSAVAQPSATFGGEFAHRDVYHMAGAYLFHIVQNHPFVDGDKRAGLLTALVFLDVNGLPIEHGSPKLYELTIGVADGRLGKEAAADTFRRLAVESNF
jgi:death on curing protein